ncbi:hypothetical protein SASPL_124912 [Salvia splendens]|uniref:Myb/SANT-like domain-containing protein n=1 Tax=Salvia splendens TaxID=180675 RepID=A0A8X8XEN7_SALSN|nr:hypothetical protein SASPL_124912 [Salvia splendens]
MGSSRQCSVGPHSSSSFLAKWLARMGCTYPRNLIPSTNSSQGTQVSGQGIEGRYKKCDRPRRGCWTDREDVALIAGLKELVAICWKSDNGFRSGYQKKLELWMKKEFPSTDLKGNPRISSKISAWKKSYYSLSQILERSSVGFNENGKFKIDCDDDQWDQIVRVEQNVQQEDIAADNDGFSDYHVFLDDMYADQNVNNFTGGSEGGEHSTSTTQTPKEPSRLLVSAKGQKRVKGCSNFLVRYMPRQHALDMAWTSAKLDQKSSVTLMRCRV